MSIFNWLFGAKSTLPTTPSVPTWQLSENGNPTIIFPEGQRLTVFNADGGWKYCRSESDGSDDPIFSEPYETEAAARYEALAFAMGSPSRYVSIREKYKDEDCARWTALIIKLRKDLEQSDLNVTQLRKIESKIATQIRQLKWQSDEFRRRNVDEQAIRVGEKLGREFSELADLIAQRITERKAARTSGAVVRAI